MARSSWAPSFIIEWQTPRAVSFSVASRATLELHMYIAVWSSIYIAVALLAAAARTRRTGAGTLMPAVLAGLPLPHGAALVLSRNMFLRKSKRRVGNVFATSSECFSDSSFIKVTGLACILPTPPHATLCMHRRKMKHGRCVETRVCRIRRNDCLRARRRCHPSSAAADPGRTTSVSRTRLSDSERGC